MLLVSSSSCLLVISLAAAGDNVVAVGKNTTASIPMRLLLVCVLPLLVPSAAIATGCWF